jgi:hypothetical protein
MKKEPKVVRKNIAISPKLFEMSEEIRNEKGFKTFTSVVEFAVSELHSATFPAYVMAKRAIRRTPEERAEDIVKTGELKKQMEEERLTAIAKRLNGSVFTDGTGNKRVKYYTYDKSNRYEQDVPLEMMSEDLIEGQYFPSKEDILFRQKNGKVNY